jgi:hypothetical protein
MGYKWELIFRLSIESTLGSWKPKRHLRKITVAQFVVEM